MPNEFQEQIRYTATDETKQATDSANRNLASIEAQAKKAGLAVTESLDAQVKKVVTITQQATSQIERTVRAAERRAQFTGADPAQRMQAQQAIERSRVAGDSERLNRLIQAHNAEAAAIARKEQAEKLLDATRQASAVKERAILGEQTRAQTLAAEKAALLNKLQTSGAEAKAIKETALAYDLLIKKEEEAALAEKARQAVSKQRGIFAAAQGIATGGVGGITQAAGAGGALEGLMTGAGAAALGAGAGIAALAGLTIASVKAAASLGQYAEEIRNVQERTGLSAQEVQKFSVAARASGTDIGVVTGLMRGLTTAVEGNTKQAEHAREVLQGFGVDVGALRAGAASTGETIMKIAEGLNAMGASFEQRKDAMDLFKKAGIGSLPFLEALERLSKNPDFQKMMFPDEQKIAEWSKYNDQLVIAEGNWANIKRNISDILALPGLMHFLDKITSAMAGQAPFSMSAQIAADQERERQQAAREEAARIRPLAERALAGYQTGGGKLGLEARISALESQLTEARGKIPTAAEVTTDKQLADMKEQIGLVRQLEGQVEALRDRQKALNQEQEQAKKLGDEAAAALIKQGQAMDILRAGTGTYREATAIDKIVAKYYENLHAIEEIEKATGRVDTAARALNETIKRASVVAQALEDHFKDIAATIKQMDADWANSQQIRAKAFEEQLAYQDETSKIRIQTIDEDFAYSDKAAQVNRDRQLQQLSAYNAQTLDQKIGIEQQKAAIEIQYTQDTEQNKLDALARQQTAELEAAQKGAQSREDYDARIQAINDKYLQLRVNAEQDAEDQINKYRIDAAIETNRQIEEADRQVYDRVKGDVDELFNGMLRGGKGFLQAMKDVMKKELLEPVMSAISGQIAARITQSITGDQVTMRTNPMSGSPLERIFGQHGIGTVPQFTHQVTKADIPKLYNGAWPVVIMNPNSTTTPLQPGAGGGPNVAGNIIYNVVGGNLHGIIGQISGGNAASVSGGGTGAGISQSSITFPGASGSGDVTYSGPGQIFSGGGGLAGQGYGTAGGGVFANPIFGAGGVGPFIEPGGFTGQSNLPLSLPGGTGGGGGLGGILGQLGIGGTGGAGGVPTGTSSGGVGIPVGSSSALGAGGWTGALSGLITMGGLALMKSGMTGRYGREAAGAIPSGIGGFMAGSQLGPLLTAGWLSPLGGGLAGIGIGVGLHGLGQGGVSGLIQSTAGFAEAGFVLGGPIGAAIGAAVGAIAGGIRMLIKTTTQKIHDQVKSVYGIDIKDQGVLQQLAAMTKNFGGNVGATILSLPARQLIQLYALSTGQNARGLVATPVASQFANSGGQLTAVPSYFNGSPVYPGQLQSTVPYSYLNPGIYHASSSYLTTGAPVGANVVGANAAPQAINLSLDGPSTQAVLTGGAVQAIQANPRLVSVATVSGQDASAGRRDSAVNVLQPNFIVS